MVSFCPKCGSIQVPKNDNGKLVLQCTSPKCGHTVKRIDKEAKVMKETIKTKSRDVEVVDEAMEKESLPVVKAQCKKCGNNEAFFWTVQTRSADEAETRFYRCTDCKNTWREYD
jgi:DNA-directed RNA polymerase subunit M